MLCTCEAAVALDCADSLESFEALVFLPPRVFGAAVPAKAKKAQPGERR